MVAAATADLALVVLLAFGVAMRERLREAWYHWRLESGDTAEKDRAAAQLAAMGSPGGARYLYEKLLEEVEGNIVVGFDHTPLHQLLAVVSSVSKLEVRLDPTVDASAIPLQSYQRSGSPLDVLRDLLVATGLGYRFEGRTIVLCPPGKTKDTFTTVPPEAGSP